MDGGWRPWWCDRIGVGVVSEAQGWSQDPSYKKAGAQGMFKRRLFCCFLFFQDSISLCSPG